jgi:hypothetical protein
MQFGMHPNGRRRVKESIKKSSSAFIATAPRENKMIQDLSSVNLPWAGLCVRDAKRLVTLAGIEPALRAFLFPIGKQELPARHASAGSLIYIGLRVRI